MLTNDGLSITTLDAQSPILAICTDRQDALVWQEEGSLELLWPDRIHFTDDFTLEEREMIKVSLPLPSVKRLVRDGQSLYYIESSDFNHRPLQLSDHVIWRYDAASGEHTKIDSFSAVLFTVDVSEQAGTATIDTGERIITVGGQQ